MKSVIYLLLISTMLSLFAPDIAIYPGQITNVEAATKISKKKVTLIKGQSITLKVTGTQKKIKWTSSKKSVATVSSSGKVIAKKKGSATITAKVGSKKYTCKIIVESPSISKKSATLTEKDNITLNIKGTTQKITWKSSNPAVASVNSKGKVTAKKEGTAKITATVLKKKYTCKITVKKPKEDITINGTRENPHVASEYTKVTIDDYSGKKTIGIKLIETIDGTEANEIVKNENMFNEIPSDNERWILYHFQLSYISGKSELSASTIINPYCFYNHAANVSLQSSETAVFSHDLEPYGTYNVSLYSGGSSDVWFGMLVNNSIPYTTFKIDCGYDSDFTIKEVWFTTK